MIARITKTVRTTMTLSANKTRLLYTQGPKKLSAYRVYINEAVKKNNVNYTEALAAWNSLSAIEKSEYAKLKMKEDSSLYIHVKPEAIARRFHIYKVFVDANKELIGDGEQLAKKWNSLSAEDKEVLQKKADDLNTSMNLDTSNIDKLDKGEKVNAFFLFAKEVSTPGLTRANISKFWNSLSAIDKDGLKARADFLSDRKIDMSTRIKSQSSQKPISNFIYFCTKRVSSGLTLADAREEWRNMTDAEKADFTQAAVLENPLVIVKKVKVETKPFSAHMVYLLEGMAAGKDENVLASEWLLLSDADKLSLEDKASEKNVSAGFVEDASLKRLYERAYDYFICKVVGHGLPAKYARALWKVLSDDEKKRF